MDPIATAQNPELETAEEKLSRMEAAQAAETASPSVETTVTGKANVTEDRPSDAAKQSKSEVPKEESDTPSASEETVSQTEEKAPAQEPETAEKFTKDDEKRFSQWLKQSQSKYAADMAKRLVRWDAIKKTESELQAQRDSIAAERSAELAKIKSEREAWQAEQEANRPSPEQYEAWAAQKVLKAAEMLKQAEQAEEEGELDKAESLKTEALIFKRDAEFAKKAAEEQRKNPPVAQQKAQEQFVAYQKDWVQKAAIDFPEFAQKDSEVQRESAAFYNQMVNTEPAVSKLPGFIYFCAERAALKTAANRVPGLTKELTETKKRLSQLEAATSASPSGGVTKMPSGKSYLDLSPEDQFNQLKQEASALY